MQFILTQISLKFVSKGSIYNVISGKYLAKNWQQDIIWTNDDPISWPI